MIIKSILNMIFSMKTSVTKKIVPIFCEAFLILKNILLKPSSTYFHFYKRGILNSQVVRIRVKKFNHVFNEMFRKNRNDAVLF
jgi:hypothetical protein